MVKATSYGKPRVNRSKFRGQPGENPDFNKKKLGKIKHSRDLSTRQKFEDFLNEVLGLGWASNAIILCYSV